ENQEFLADGITDALINELSKIGALKVISRQSVMRYKDSDLSLPEIAADLDVDAIVSGTMIRSGDKIRVAAQLRVADSEENLWAASFDEQFENILLLYSVLAREIAEEIEVSVTPEEEVLLTAVRQVNPEAYEAYLRGHNYLYKLSLSDAETARAYFEQSLEIDSTYAKAYVGLAGVWVILQQMGSVSPMVAGPAITSSLNRALEIDSTLADVHYMQALMFLAVRWDWEAAEAEFRRALDLNPNHAEAHAYFGHLLHIVRRPDEGMVHSEKAVELDPYNALFRSLYGVVLNFQHRYDEAIVQFRMSQETAPMNFANFQGLFAANIGLGRLDEALAARIGEFEVAGDTATVSALRSGYEAGGFTEAMRRSGDALAARWQLEFVAPGNISVSYVAAQEVETALDWLERAYDARDPATIYLGTWPRRELLRGNPRYEEILRKMDLEMWLR
ncbi:MAG: hypothetical protein ACC655_06425, partial [Rhodothermia bacterium]